MARFIDAHRIFKCLRALHVLNAFIQDIARHFQTSFLVLADHSLLRAIANVAARTYGTANVSAFLVSGTEFSHTYELHVLIIFITIDLRGKEKKQWIS